VVTRKQEISVRLNPNHRSITATAIVTAGRRQRGFTMTELLITLSVAGILAVIATPAFNGIIAAQRTRTYASALFATLAKTRSEALALNNNVTLQAKAGGWATGWQIVDPNGNVLDDYTATSGLTVAATGTVPVIFRSSGRLSVTAVAPQFVISFQSGGNMNYQCVSLNLSGRPYMKPGVTTC
jgi:type IV fimbrial biogenesis protein FimT